MRTGNNANSDSGSGGEPVRHQFAQLMQAVRAGEPAACQAFVDQYSSVILREARCWLGSRFSHILSTDEVAQSVLRKFFRRMAENRFTFQDPRQLISLLKRMARNKAISRVRSEQRRTARPMGNEDLMLVDQGPRFETQTESRDLLELYRQRMSADTWQLLNYRLEGFSWEEISQKLGVRAATLRRRLDRALDYLRSTLSEDPSEDQPA